MDEAKIMKDTEMSISVPQDGEHWSNMPSWLSAETRQNYQQWIGSYALQCGVPAQALDSGLPQRRKRCSSYPCGQGAARSRLGKAVHPSDEQIPLIVEIIQRVREPKP
jgi:hypothetical protein